MTSFMCPEYKIGSTLATLKPLTWYGIPNPSNVYLPYSVTRICGNLSAKGYGFPTDTWVFKGMEQPMIDVFLGLLGGEDVASASLYMRTYKDSGVMKTPATFLATMYRPVDGNGKDLIPFSRFYYSSVQIQWVHLVEQ